MSDESDETRRFSPDDADGSSTEPEKPERPTAATPRPAPSAESDATQVAGAPPGLGDTMPGKGGRADDTLDDARRVPPIRDEPTVVQDQPGSTAVIPPVDDDDWAPSRANPAWSGRAEVRPPQPGRGYPEVDWAAAAPARQRDRWWMPIVVGVIALILLAVLGWAVYLLVGDESDDETPAPVISHSAAPSETATTQSSSPSPTPTTASPTPPPSTAPPTATEVTIPALRGLALPAAQSALRSTGLNYRLIYRQAPDVPPGTVIDSDPVEGQVVPPNTTVTLVIAAEATSTPTTEPTEDAGAGPN